jgi:hypothetical protein
MSVGFFILRAILLGHCLMGSMDNSYFQLDSHIAGVLVKYIYSFILPTPIHLNYRHHLMYLSMTPALVLTILFLFRNPWRVTLRTGITVCILFFIALAPTIGLFSIWRLYYPSVLWVVLLVFLVSKTRLPGGRSLVYGYIGCLAVLMAFGGMQFIRGGRFEKELLKQAAALPERSIVFINVPVAYASQVTLIPANDEFEYALERFYGIKKRVHLEATSMVDKLPASFILQKVRDDSVSIHLDPHRYNYYYNTVEESKNRIIEATYGGPFVYGKPTSARVTAHNHTDGLYVFKNAE